MDLQIEIQARDLSTGVRFDTRPSVGRDLTLKELLEFQKNTLIRIARNALNEAQSRNNFPKDEFVTITDRRVGKPLEQINAFGQVEFSARLSIVEVVGEMIRRVYERSKIVTGQYIRGHVLLYNGKEVARTPLAAAAWAREANIKPGDTIRLINIEPYARRLELLGVTAQQTSIKTGLAKNKGQRSAGIQVRKPNGAYYLTFLSLKRQTGGFSKSIGTFKYENVSGADISGIRGGFFKNQSGKSRNGRPYVYPSILFTVNSQGVST